MSELLAAAEERWRLTVDSAPVGIALVGLDGRCFDTNAALCEILGYSYDELVSLHTRDVILADDYEPFRVLTRDLLAGVTPRFQVRKRHVRSDGEVVWLEVYVTVARAPAGDPVHFIVYFHDVSQHIATTARLDRINQDLIEQTARLARSNDDLEAFATVASHDLQAPLTTIRGYLELLETEYAELLGSRGDLWLARAGDAAARMSELLRSLLEFSRAAGSGEPRREPVVVDAVLRQVLADLDGASTGAALTVHTSGTDAEVLADRSRLHQVLQNLVQNALKYRHPERSPEISVRVVEEAQAWRIEIADNGRGVPEAQRESIFGMFQQAHPDAAGFGVGLAVTRRIVERHGGTIWVEPLPAGSRFCFTLPRPEVTT